MGSDLISRQAAIDAFDKEIWSNIDIPICKEIRTAVKKTIEQLPSSQPERKTGRWIECDHEKWIMGVHALRCSECSGGYHLSNEMTIYYWNYCPVCGCRMTEVEHE